jgi:hypothetical protein
MADEEDNGNDMGTALRDALSDAFDTAATTGEAEAPEQAATDTAEPGGQAPEGAEAPWKDEGGYKAVESQPGGEADSAAPAVDGGKDGEGAQDAAGTDSGGEADSVDSATAAPPASWRPLARESWAQRPETVRAEVQRRETEINRALNDGAESRKMGEAMAQAAAPYAQMIAMEGSDPVSSAASMFQTAAVLKSGTPRDQAGTIARIVQMYNIDVQLLDQALSAGMPQQTQQPANGQQPPAPAYDPRIDQVIQQQQQMMSAQQSRENQHRQQVQSAMGVQVEGFGKDHEFFADLRASMADIVDVAHMQGRDMPLQQAYDTAIAMRPEIGQVIAQRAAAKAAGNGSANRAKRAASSVKDSPSGGKAPPRDDLRGAILEAFNG